MTQVWPGSAYPLGATYDGTGTNFAIFSEVAEKVELCLFDDEGNEERIRLPEMDGYVWHAFLPGIHPGQRYGFRVHGPYDPAQGLRCNPNKLLLDPYAKAIDGQIDWDQSVFGYDFETKERNDDDSAPHMPKSVVVNPYFDWDVDRWADQPPLRDTPGLDSFTRFGSVHPGGWHAVFCDGSVRSVSYDVDKFVHKHLANRGDGQTIPDGSY